MTDAEREFAGHVALVTGGTSGIGLATARAFLAAGASVAICGRSPERGEQVARDLASLGEVAFIAADVTDERSVRRLVESTVSRFGRLDHAFNNAANTDAVDDAVDDARSGSAFTDMSLAEFEGIVRTSLTSVWLCMKHQLPALVESRGTIVNTSSKDAELRLAGTGLRRRQSRRRGHHLHRRKGVRRPGRAHQRRTSRRDHDADA